VTTIEALLVGEPGRFDPSGVSIESVLAIAYLIAFGSMLAYTTYAWLLKNAPLSLVGTYAYVNPVVAVALGSVFLHEEIGPRTIVASGIILAAVAIIVTARGRMAVAPASVDGIEAPDRARAHSEARART
jgi:drug/metabolite transporter (DMT)-like permease